MTTRYTLRFDVRPDERAGAIVRTEYELEGAPYRLRITVDADRELGDAGVTEAVTRGLRAGYRWALMTTNSGSPLESGLADPWICVEGSWLQYSLPPGSQPFFDDGYRRGWAIRRERAAGFEAGHAAATAHTDVTRLNPPRGSSVEFRRGFRAAVEAVIEGRNEPPC